MQSLFFSLYLIPSCINSCKNPSLYKLQFCNCVCSMVKKKTSSVSSTYTYNTIIKNSTPQMALKTYVKMKSDGVNCDNYTYPFVLKACKMLFGLWEGKQVHCEVIKVGLFDSNVFVRNALIALYSKSREMTCARLLFDDFDGKDLVSWNLILSGLVESGHMVQARKLFDEMPLRDVISCSIMIHGYAKKTSDVACARSLFDQMHTRDMVTWNTMIDSYVKVGDMIAARELFDGMEHRNVISWSSMINGYSQHGDPKEALNVFNQMLSHDIKADKFCVVGAISSCAQLGALDQGRWIHLYLKKKKITVDIVVNTALVDMYMKCGSTEEARAVFISMPERNVVSWNVMISGLGINGFGDEALSYFSQMQHEGIQMDDMIFVSVLSACSHGGFLTKGLEIFRRIRKPKVEHYGCLIDLLVRAGKLAQALNFIKSMPMEPNSDLWTSVLLGCRVQKKVHLGEFVLNKLKELNADDCGVYALMSNLYADNAMWEGVMKMRKLVLEKGMVKESGKSVIDVVGGGFKEFVCSKKARF